jgi:hypothetical protein
MVVIGKWAERAEKICMSLALGARGLKQPLQLSDYLLD